MTGERERLVRDYVAAYNAIDIEGMLAPLHEDVAFENRSGGQVTIATTGKQAFANLARQSASLFAERRQEIVSWSDEGETVRIEVGYRAVLAQDFPGGGPKAGDVLELRGTTEFGFRDGLIARIVDHS